MNTLFKSAAILTLMLAASPSGAAPVPEVVEADTNENGRLEPAEAQVLIDEQSVIAGKPSNTSEAESMRARNLVSAIELAQADYPVGEPIPIDKIVIRTDEASQCIPDAAVVLVRESLRDSHPNLCARRGESGLTIPFEQDRVAGTSELTVKGGVGYAFALPGQVFGAQSAMIYLEADGTFANDGNGTGTVYAGVNLRAETDISDSVLLDLSGGLFALTDTNFDADGYGARLSVVPVAPRYALNIRPLGRDLHWTLSGEIEALYIGDAGATGFEGDTEEVIGTVEVGLLYDIKENDAFQFGAQLSATGTYSYDFVDEASFDHLEVTFTRYMDEEQTVGLEVVHERGHTIQSAERVEQTSLQWTFAF